MAFLIRPKVLYLATFIIFVSQLQYCNMFKKKIAFLYFLAAVLIFTACNKDISPDEPFPDERKRTVFITTTSNRLYGYNVDNGARTWEKTLSGNVPGTPVITNDALYLLTDVGTLYGWDLKTQELKFEPIFLSSFSTNNSLAATNDAIFIPADSLYRYDVNGNKVWGYRTNTGGPATSPATIHNGLLYVAFSDVIRCLDFDKKLIWSRNVGSLVSTTIKATDDGLFFGTTDNNMNAIEIADGAPRWKYTTLSTVRSSPLVYGGMSISGSDDNTINCVDMIAGPGQSPQLRWTIATAERVVSSPAIHVESNTVLVGCNDFNLYAIDHVSGELKYKYPTGSLITSSPVVLENKAYFASFDKYMYCIDVVSGDLIWKTNMNYSANGSPIIDNVNSERYCGASGMSLY